MLAVCVIPVACIHQLPRRGLVCCVCISLLFYKCVETDEIFCVIFYLGLHFVGQCIFIAESQHYYGPKMVVNQSDYRWQRLYYNL